MACSGAELNLGNLKYPGSSVLSQAKPNHHRMHNLPRGPPHVARSGLTIVRKQERKIAAFSSTHSDTWGRQDSSLDADERIKLGDHVRQPRRVRRTDDGTDVLVGARGLLGDAPHGRALDDNAPFAQRVDDLPASPCLGRLMAAHLPAGTVACR